MIMTRQCDIDTECLADADPLTTHRGKQTDASVSLRANQLTLPLESVSHNRDHELACLG
jgi:hypothetical protein